MIRNRMARLPTGWTAFLFMCLFAWPAPTAGQTLQMAFRLEEGAVHLIQMFDEMLEATRNIADQAARDHLIDELSKLAKDLYSLEWSKRFLVDGLRAGIGYDEAGVTLREIEESVAGIRRRLHDIGLEILKIGGDDVETHLVEATFTKTYWLEEAKREIRARALRHSQGGTLQPVEEDVLRRGEAAADRLREANLKLLELIKALRNR